MNENRCINNLLKLICLLQKNSINSNKLDNSCDKPYLGPTLSNACYNTRPISIYKKNGSIYTVNTDEGETTFFRVENIENNCITLRALINNDNNYISTNNFITIKINCICAVRCYNDVLVSNL